MHDDHYINVCVRERALATQLPRDLEPYLLRAAPVASQQEERQWDDQHEQLAVQSQHGANQQGVDHEAEQDSTIHISRL
jgi:hypothetical protein